MFNTILVVCTGNICRSPIGEHLLRGLLSNKIVDSAGTNALVGHAADPSASKIASRHGLCLDGHKGKHPDAMPDREYRPDSAGQSLADGGYFCCRPDAP